MIKRAGYGGALLAGFFSIYLLGWRAQMGVEAEWVSGFLAVFWSLIMMLRLMTLTEPLAAAQASGYLAQKIINSLREKQEISRAALLEKSFGGSYIWFVLAGIVFAVWQILCTIFPTDAAILQGLSLILDQFFSRFSVEGLSQNFWSDQRLFDWGHRFLLFLSFCMMGFVFRSYAPDKGMTRATLLILCAYAGAGYIFFLGLNPSSNAITINDADLMGNGAGAMSYLLSTMPVEKGLSLFDMLLIETGVVGLGIIAFLVFVPLSHICLTAGRDFSDPLTVFCGLVSGIILILGLFLEFTPLLCGLLALTIIAVFLAWGAAEVPPAEIPA